MCFATVVGNDVVGDLFQTGRGLHNLCCVDSFYLDVLDAILAFEGSYVLDGKLQGIFVADCIGDQVAVEPFSKQIFGCAFSQGILCSVLSKNRCACETKELDCSGSDVI